MTQGGSIWNPKGTFLARSEHIKKFKMVIGFEPAHFFIDLPCCQWAPTAASVYSLTVCYNSSPLFLSRCTSARSSSHHIRTCLRHPSPSPVSLSFLKQAGIGGCWLVVKWFCCTVAFMEHSEVIPWFHGMENECDICEKQCVINPKPKHHWSLSIIGGAWIKELEN